MEKIFVSYGTKYDSYFGYKDWTELTNEEQDKIIQAELSDNETDIEALIMGTGLKKAQAKGLHSLFVSISFFLEREGIIKNMQDWSEVQRNSIIKFMNGTRLGERISEAFSDKLQKTSFSGSELEQFSVPYAMDCTIDMLPSEMKLYIHSKLSLLEDLIDNSQSAMSFKNPHIPHADFIKKLKDEQIAFYVDRGLALTLGASGYPIGKKAFSFSILFWLTVMIFLPVWIYWGWAAGLGILATSIIARRLITWSLIQKIKTDIFYDEKFYEICRDKNIIKIITSG